MKGLIILLGFLYGIISNVVGQSSVSIIDFSTNNNKVERGDTILINWEVSGVDSVYILGVGGVLSTGKQDYVSSKTKELYLFVETKDTLLMESLAIKIKGSKNLAPFPHEKYYEQNYYRKLKISFEGIGSLLDIVSEILEEQSFAIKEDFYRKENIGIIQTNFRLYNKLKQPEDYHIKNRRISYQVTVSPLGSKQYELQFKIALGFQRKAERKWIQDPKEEHYNKALTQIEKLFTNKLKQ